MPKKLPDIIATIKLYETDMGGRQGPTPPEQWRCRLILDEISFDAILWLDAVGSIAPGQEVRIPINFLSHDTALNHCSIGKKFFVSELREVGEGTIDEISARR